MLCFKKFNKQATVDEVVEQPVSVGGLTLDLTGWPVDSLKLVSVIGLPNGISWFCNNSNCSWLGDDVGCIELFGTPTVGGVYDLIFQIDGFITLGAMGVMSVSGATGGYLDYTGYQITVSTCIPNFSVNTDNEVIHACAATARPMFSLCKCHGNPLTTPEDQTDRARCAEKRQVAPS